MYIVASHLSVSISISMSVCLSVYVSHCYNFVLPPSSSSSSSSSSPNQCLKSHPARGTRPSPRGSASLPVRSSSSKPSWLVSRLTVPFMFSLFFIPWWFNFVAFLAYVYLISLQCPSNVSPFHRQSPSACTAASSENRPVSQ